MDRIKQALEHAREDLDEDAAALVSRNNKPVSQLSRLSNQQPAIAYSQTRSFDFSDRTLGRRRIISGLLSDPVTDAYRVLRTQLLQRMQLNSWNSIAVTSVGPGEGKTLTAINLAISLAREVNHTVLLCDLDLKRPRVHEYFGQLDNPGLSDYLFGDKSLPEILFNPGIPGLVVLPGRAPVLASSETLSSPKMVQLVDDLKSRYPSRITLFDLPPLTAADDVITFSPHVDAVLLVAQEGKTRREYISRAVELLDPTPLIGTVLNHASESTSEAY